MFKGFTNTNPLIKTISRPVNATMAGFAQQGLPSNLKLGQHGCVPEDGLVARFRADTNITLNGNNVAAWSDTTGTYTLSQATTGSQPAFVAANATPFLNYKPAVYFTGGKSLSISNTFGLDSEPVRGIFAVLYNQAYNNLTGNLIYFSNGSSGSYFLYSYDGSYGQYSEYFNPPTPTSVRIGQPHYLNSIWLAGLEVNRGNAMAYSYNYNYVYDNKAILSTLTNYNTGTFFIAGNNAGWYLAELLVYNKSIATAPIATRNNLLYYVKNQYGLI